MLPRLTLNLGFRYERQGQLGEMLGRASTFNIAAANPNPPAEGTLQVDAEAKLNHWADLANQGTFLWRICDARIRPFLNSIIE